MNEVSVSVIVPTRNSARTLEACLRSVKAQTYAPIELIVVDRASTDGTQAIAARYADVSFDAGPERSAQRNEGARRAKGEVVVFIDSDMVLSEGVIAACVAAMAGDPSAVGVVIPEESFGAGFWAQCKRLERSFYVGVPWMEAARFFRRADVLAAGGYDEALVSGEDWDLSQRIAAKGRLLRITEFIRHDEGKLALGTLLRKKRYYAARFAAYAKKSGHAQDVARQTGILGRYGLFFSRPRRLFARPLVGLGMLFMKTCEFVVGAVGYAMGTSSAPRQAAHDDASIAVPLLTERTVDISVVIPTYNAASDLRTCLEALLASSFDPSRFEIIVVDDGSTDDTEAVVAEYLPRTLPKIRYLKRDRKDGFGPGVARGDGIAIARGRVIAATDADCIVDKGWLSAIADAVLVRGLSLVCGDTWCDEVLLFPWRVAPAGHVGVTANLAYDVGKVGPIAFSRDFQGFTGDDTDFLFRVIASGHSLTYVPAMRVHHPPRSMTLLRVLRRSLSRKNEVLLFKRHGRQVLSNMHPFFQPRILGRVSPATLCFLIACAAVVAVVLRPIPYAWLLSAAIISGSIAFLAHFYRAAITYMPAKGGRVTLGERCKTLVFIAAYIPCFVLARAIGSVRFRFLLL